MVPLCLGDDVHTCCTLPLASSTCRLCCIPPHLSATFPQTAGFEFDKERAEWLRWFNEIRAFKQRHGHCQPHPLAHPNGEATL